jgi:hypothetical protein
MTADRDTSTQFPDYWPGKRRGAEHRVRLAAKALARLTTANGNARQTPEYADAFRELLAATTGFQSVLYATPREHRDGGR